MLNVQRFVKRPVEVQAVRTPEWTGSYTTLLNYLDLCHDIAAWCGGTTEWDKKGRVAIAIPTAGGVMEASPGDWIIRGVEGEFYPCKDSIFAQTYEHVGEISHPDQPAIPGV